MSYRIIEKQLKIQPRIIIHGGAGNISRKNLSKDAYAVYRKVMLQILHDANAMLCLGATAIDAATYAVQQLEQCPLFNSGRGAVFTTAGTHELEASVMVSRGCRKRGVGVMNVKRTKSPITLAREMLLRGESSDGGGAQGHCQLQGDICDKLAAAWGLETVNPSYFWTRKRWDEHRRGLGLSHTDKEYARAREDADAHTASEHAIRTDASPGRDPSWDGVEYLPQGTVGAVALDSTGTLCVCTSTGGLTNKLPGRIGDTPTLGAGFWAEEWLQEIQDTMNAPVTSMEHIAAALRACLPTAFDNVVQPANQTWHNRDRRRAVAMSGTGNGDSFLRLSAVRTAAAIAQFSGDHVTLQQAVTSTAGPNGALQRSAEDRWLKSGEGEGGIIGIELRNGKGECVADFNCGGMFRAWIQGGEGRFLVFEDEY